MFAAAQNVWNNIVGNDGGAVAWSEPSAGDVLVVRAMLQRAGALPLELVDSIIDAAEYWPHTHAELVLADNEAICVPSRPRQRGSDNRLVLRTAPLGFLRPPVTDAGAATQYATQVPVPRPVPRPVPLPVPAPADDAENENQGQNEGGGATPAEDATSHLCSDDEVRRWLPAAQAPPLEHPCRKIVFTLVSHDQGWATHGGQPGSYDRSYTWFDVGLEKFVCDDMATSDAASDAAPANDAAPLVPHVPPSATLCTICPAVIPDTARNADGVAQSWKFDIALLPGDTCLQKNRVATRASTEHTIVWSWTDSADQYEAPPPPTPPPPPPAETAAPVILGPAPAPAPADQNAAQQVHPLERIGRGKDTGNGEFVRSLRVGDVVTVWAKARFGGWVNTVKTVKIDVYWFV